MDKTDKVIQKIGVLSGGGDCPGVNAVIRAIVKTARDKYNMTVIGFENGFGGLIQNRGRVLTERDISGILPRGGTILGTTNRDNPFNYTLCKGGKYICVDVSDSAAENVCIHCLEALIVIGGIGSLKIAKEFSEKNVPIIGVPKTIENDLWATEKTFGYDTALNTAMDAIDKLHSTAESHHRVMVLEVKGQKSGWLALEAGLAGGADVILIPEIPFDLEKVYEKIESRRAQEDRFSIIVVAEGARNKKQKAVGKSIAEDVAAEVENKTGMETRPLILGHLQRGGSPTAYDRILATRFGVAAVEAAVEGNFNSIVSLQCD
ncbi:MAG TPA: ATP-dependent 6-phosphofructokinase, partial [Clostridia bacterium]|nr:ATP-dependent 6-phosphofructokinase [Clostridia bacterium]